MIEADWIGSGPSEGRIAAKLRPLNGLLLVIVIGPLVGLVGSLQALEAMKLLAGFGEPLVGRLLLIDALGTRLRELRVKRDPACAVCGQRDA